MLRRRKLLAGLTATLCPSPGHARSRRISHLLVRACWQSFSMGEVAQVAGLLQILQEELPKVTVTLWATNLENGVGEWLKNLYPKVALVTGTTGDDGLPDQPALQQAWKAADFLMHGPAATVVARNHLEAWRRKTGKPFGIYGVTLPITDEKLEALLSAASFVWLRDGVSRAAAAKLRLPESQIGFGPDSAFAMSHQNSKAADDWLLRHDLDKRPFLCVVPKLRFTPYWQIYRRPPKYAEIAQADQNNQFQESDHQPLVDALIRCLQIPDLHILICPEMPYEAEIGTKWILQKLPEPLQSRCIVRSEPWLPDEAAATFAKAKCLLSLELLSCVVSAAAGTPAFHVCLPEDRKSGQMWRDVGFKHWIVDRDQASGELLADKLLTMMEDAPGNENETKLTGAAKFIAERQHLVGEILREMMEPV